jgi:cellulose 1,4-beta-cellobiosidase
MRNVSSNPISTVFFLTTLGGGNGWTGATSCVSGYTCTFSNDWYSQCLPGSNGGGPATTAKPTTTSPGGPSTTSPPSGGSAGNPFAGVQQYANPYYSSEIYTSAIPSLTGTAAVKASAVAKVGTFVWL